jgi:DNA-binding FadR family transcriptional regulator
MSNKFAPTPDHLLEQAGIRSSGAKALAHHLMEEMRTGRLSEGVKIPPERELAEQFGASRGTVRRVLSALREHGLITQTVGSGTFATALASQLLHQPPAASNHDLQEISPAELMEARLLIEPLMPALIALHATGHDFAQMDTCLKKAAESETFEEFEIWDAALHRVFAEATHNGFFLQVLNLTNAFREQSEWGRLKRKTLTPERRARYEREHMAIVLALKDRDAQKATALLRKHLKSIQETLLAQ